MKIIVVLLLSIILTSSFSFYKYSGEETPVIRVKMAMGGVVNVVYVPTTIILVLCIPPPPPHDLDLLRKLRKLDRLMNLWVIKKYL